jgi:hypothetical protein
MRSRTPIGEAAQLFAETAVEMMFARDARIVGLSLVPLARLGIDQANPITLCDRIEDTRRAAKNTGRVCH